MEALGFLRSDEAGGGQGQCGGESGGDFGVERFAEEAECGGGFDGGFFCAGVFERNDECVDHRDAAMDMDFEMVVGEAEDEGVVDGRFCVWIENCGAEGFSDGEAGGFVFANELEEDGGGVFAGEGDDGDGAGAGGGELDSDGFHTGAAL